MRLANQGGEQALDHVAASPGDQMADHKTARLCNPVVDHYAARTGKQQLEGEVSTATCNDSNNDPDEYPRYGRIPSNVAGHMYVR